MKNWTLGQKSEEQLPLPNDYRYCNNPICLVFGVLFLLGLAYPIYLLFSNSSPGLVGRPVDPDGKFCGGQAFDNRGDTSAQSYPYVYFTTPYRQFLHRAVCVKSCPTSQHSALQCLPNSVITDCKTKYSFDNISQQVLVYPSTAYKDWACLPLIPAYFSRVKQATNPGFINSFVLDVKNLKWLLLLAFLSTLLLTICLLQCSKLAKGPILISVCAVVLLLTTGLYCLFRTVARNAGFSSFGQDTEPTSSEEIQSWMEQYNPNFAPIVVATVVLMFVGLVLFVLVCRNRNQHEHISKFHAAMEQYYDKRLLIYAVVFLLVCVGAAILTGWIFLLLSSSSLTSLSENPFRIPTEAIKNSLDLLFPLLCLLLLAWYLKTYDFYMRFVLMGTSIEFCYLGQEYSPCTALTRLPYSLGSGIKSGILELLYSPLILIEELTQVFTQGESCSTCCHVVNRWGVYKCYLNNQEFVISCREIMEEFQKWPQAQVARAIFTLFRWTFMATALALVVIIFALVAKLGGWVYSSYFNLILLVSLAGLLPAMAMSSLAADVPMAYFITVKKIGGNVDVIP